MVEILGDESKIYDRFYRYRCCTNVVLILKKCFFLNFCAFSLKKNTQDFEPLL